MSCLSFDTLAAALSLRLGIEPPTYAKSTHQVPTSLDAQTPMTSVPAEVETCHAVAAADAVRFVTPAPRTSWTSAVPFQVIVPDVTDAAFHVP